MPLRQSGCIEYSFTTQETRYLTTENKCFIDNLARVTNRVYCKELKLNKDKIIKLNKEVHGIVEEDDNEPEFIESDLGNMIINFKYNNDNELQMI
jgi:hypothetical protein